jgi:TrmH family RNA methyltransferase
MIISSQRNQHIKQIRSLRHRHEREQNGLFFIEGIRIVTEAAQLGAEIETLVVAPDLLKSEFGREIVWAQQDHGTACIEVTAEVFSSISSKDGPQGIGAVVRQRWEALEHIRLANGQYWVALDAAQDPGNIGTILRTGDAAGSPGLILLGNCADPYDATALRASMGAIFSQRLVKASFADFVQWKQQHHYFVAGTSRAAFRDYRKVSYQFPLVLLMGSERLGLSSEQQARCDMMVKIPLVGRSDSLNLAVATGITLYEIFHQAHGDEKLFHFH